MNASVNPKYSILVVDDDLDLNTTFALMLEFDGHEVRAAYTCEAALLMLEKLHFDLIIAEYWLPGMKGNEFAALIKRACPDQPIIMTAASFEEIKVEEASFNAVDCLLTKPFSLRQLREAIIWVFEVAAETRLNLLVHQPMPGNDVVAPDKHLSAHRKGRTAPPNMAHD